MAGTTGAAVAGVAEQDSRAAASARPLVVHLASGGFSGATQVAVTLVRAQAAGDAFAPTLVLRRKRSTDPARVAALRAEGLRVEVAAGGWSVVSIASLWRLLRRLRPAAIVCHGFSEHLWGRWAALAAGVPVLVHVEHNSRERYGVWRLAQARWLARHTDAIVGCSEGVASVLRGLGMPAERVVAIANGIDLAPFAGAGARPWRERAAGIVMAARFARQKDHATLVRAAALLRERGLDMPVLLAGGGSSAHRRKVERLVDALGLRGRVHVLGPRPDVPALLMAHRHGVLATHWEGMPLALAEAMAAGCTVVASAVPGIVGTIVDGVDARLVADGDAVALADAIEAFEREPDAAVALAESARRRAHERFGVARMTAAYDELLRRLIARATNRPRP